MTKEHKSLCGGLSICKSGAFEEALNRVITEDVLNDDGEQQLLSSPKAAESIGELVAHEMGIPASVLQCKGMQTKIETSIAQAREEFNIAVHNQSHFIIIQQALEDQNIQRLKGNMPKNIAH